MTQHQGTVLDHADMEVRIWAKARAEELLHAAIVMERLATGAKVRAGQRNGLRT